jgi:hypothetical protein
MDDRIATLLARLAALDDTPVSGHPDILEAVHRELVAELDELAGGTSRGQHVPGRDRPQRG